MGDSRVKGIALTGAVAALTIALLASAPAQAAFPGTDGSIAFDGGLFGARTSTAVYGIQSDGSGLDRLTKPPRGRGDSDPAYSPNGKQIVFSRDGTIFISPATGRHPRKVTTGDEPSFSAAGNYLVFARTGTCRSDHADYVSSIYKIKIHGGKPVQLTHGGGHCLTDRGPQWSPRGNLIVFSRDGGLATMKPDGTAVKRLNVPQTGEYAPDWAPSGDRIAFYRRTHGPGAAKGIWTVNPQGKQLQLVFDDPTSTQYESDPAYSPSGKQIAFNLRYGSFNTQARIFTVAASGGQPVQVTPEDYDASDPSWQPQ